MVLYGMGWWTRKHNHTIIMKQKRNHTNTWRCGLINQCPSTLTLLTLTITRLKALKRCGQPLDCVCVWLCVWLWVSVCVGDRMFVFFDTLSVFSSRGHTLTKNSDTKTTHKHTATRSHSDIHKHDVIHRNTSSLWLVYLRASLIYYNIVFHSVPCFVKISAWVCALVSVRVWNYVSLSSA